MEQREPFGELLKYWRGVRGLSQLNLALHANVSSRHISFIETGRSRPSREMVVQLSNALDVPFRERNGLLQAAGYALLYRETGLDEPQLADTKHALNHILEAHDPHGALVVDRYWNVVMANRAIQALWAQLLDPALLAGGGTINVMDLLLDPALLRPYFVNWPEIAAHLLERLHRESLGQPTDEKFRALIDRIEAYPDLPTDWAKPDLEQIAGPYLTIHMRAGPLDLRFFTTITTFGTPLDVTLQELRIESFHPADPETREHLQQIVDLHRQQTGQMN